MPETEKVMNRWLVVAGGILIQLCLGAIYAWSAFTGPLTKEGGAFEFSGTAVQSIFSLGLLSFAGVMALVAGKWQKKSGPRVVALTGGLVLGAGYVLAALSGTNFWGILIGVGLLGGAGIGLAYVCPIAALVKWFPDKKGLITGLAVAGFGFGALIWIKLTDGFMFGPYNAMPWWDGLYAIEGWGVSEVFRLYGVLFAALVVLGSLVMVNPPDGWRPVGWVPPEGLDASSTGGVDFNAREMVKTPQFWGLFGTFLVGATAGLMVIGVIQLFGKDALTGSGYKPKTATFIATTAMGLFFSLANGLGRIVWGSISDLLGRRNSIVLMSALQGVIMILFYFVGGYPAGLYLAAAIIGFNFGGNFALFPAATADYFGNTNVGTNYPLVFLSYGAGGVIGPILGGVMRDLQAWMWAFIPAGIACLLAAGMMKGLKPPKKA